MLHERRKCSSPSGRPAPHRAALARRAASFAHRPAFQNPEIFRNRSVQNFTLPEFRRLHYTNGEIGKYAVADPLHGEELLRRIAAENGVWIRNH